MADNRHKGSSLDSFHHEEGVLILPRFSGHPCYRIVVGEVKA